MLIGTGLARFARCCNSGRAPFGELRQLSGILVVFSPTLPRRAAHCAAPGPLGRRSGGARVLLGDDPLRLPCLRLVQPRSRGPPRRLGRGVARFGGSRSGHPNVFLRRSHCSDRIPQDERHRSAIANSSSARQSEATGRRPKPRRETLFRHAFGSARRLALHFRAVLVLYRCRGRTTLGLSPDFRQVV